MVHSLPKEPNSLAHFITPTADAILNSTLNIPLKGAAIGNGWMDSKSQYPAYIEYAVKTGLIEENSKVRLIFPFIQEFKSNDFSSSLLHTGLEKGQRRNGFLCCPSGRVEDEPNDHRPLYNGAPDDHGCQKSSVCDTFFSTLSCPLKKYFCCAVLIRDQCVSISMTFDWRTPNRLVV